MKNEIRKTLEPVFTTYMNEYIDNYDTDVGFVAMSNNARIFGPIFENFVETLTKKANEYLDKNGKELKEDVLEYYRELTLKFGRSMINPSDL